MTRAVVAHRHFCRQFLAPGGVDAFTDDDERVVGADAHLSGARTQNCLNHKRLFLSITVYQCCELGECSGESQTA